MEMTKNRMISVQLIATIFRQLLGARSDGAEADSVTKSTANPAIATHSQTRLSASSMVSRISYATGPSDAMAFPPNFVD